MLKWVTMLTIMLAMRPISAKEARMCRACSPGHRLYESGGKCEKSLSTFVSRLLIIVSESFGSVFVDEARQSTAFEFPSNISTASVSTLYGLVVVVASQKGPPPKPPPPQPPLVPLQKVTSF